MILRRSPRLHVLAACSAALVFSMALVAQTPVPTPAAATTVKLQEGTIIPIVLTDTLSSGTNKANDPVHAEVSEDVAVAGVVVLSKGAPVVGHVTEAKPKGRFGHAGKLSFSFDYAKAVDGTNVRLRASTSESGKSKSGAIMLGLSGAFIHGKDVTIRKGTAFTAYADGDKEIAVPSASKAVDGGGAHVR